MIGRLAFLLVLLGACRDQGDPIGLPEADVAGYQASVHPILEARCATLDCHGNLDRPLRLYAETGLRAADALRAQPITAAEIDADARALIAVDPAPDGRRSLVLTKPLAGAVKHVGGDQWDSEAEPQYVCVAGWLDGRLDDPDVSAACLAAAAEVMLPPP
jgi:hypothetical protein